MTVGTGSRRIRTECHEQPRVSCDEPKNERTTAGPKSARGAHFTLLLLFPVMSTGATIVEPSINIVNTMQQQSSNSPEEEEEEIDDSGGGGGGVAAARTPQRNGSSLAHDPISTPIASAKRPRGAVTSHHASSSSGSGPNHNSSRMVLSTPTTTTTATTTTGRSSAIDTISLSPMHSVKPVHREALEDEIKDIFSPVAHFLHETEHSNSIHNHNDDESIDQDSITQPHVGDDDEFNPWTFIQTLPPYETLQPNPVTLPPARDSTKKCLVLDLDETLVHCSVDAPANGTAPSDLTFPVIFHGNHYTVHVKLRPWLQPFLESVSTKFEVIVFTASQKVYADALLNLIDPGTLW
jgi:NLI interacting factor-like phosphatase